MTGSFAIESYYYVIWAAAFLTAVVSATIGMLGGTVLIAVMAQYLKMEVLIPVHGLIQLTSNSSRAWFVRDAINWKISAENLVGVLLGAVVGSFYLVRVDESVYSVFLGAFILMITFVPKFKAPLNFRGKWIAVGFGAAFLGLFVGAVGVFLGAVFLADKLAKRELIATQAVCQTFVHIAKVLVFMTLGFAISPWLPLLAGTLAMTFLGSWVGTRVLDRVPEKLFRRVLTVFISLLALRLVAVGIHGLVR